MESARKLNYFPNKHGVSKHYSPRMILHQEDLDYKSHCRFTFGGYVQAHEDNAIKNNNGPRSLDCIYLRSSGNSQGGHELLHLQTNRVITRQKCTPLPITPSIIKQVHKIAELDNMPKGLKITNRANQVIFDSTWLAGVDYEDKLFDDEDYEEDEEESEGEIENEEDEENEE